MSRRLLLALSVLALTSGVVEAQAERHSLRGPRIVIWNLAGRAQIIPTTGTEVVVEVTRGGPDGAAITVRTSGSELAMIYPERTILYDEARSNNYSTSLRVNDDGTFAADGGDGSAGHTVRISNRGRGFDGHADLRILVPRGQVVEVNVAVGEMDASDVESDITMRTRFSPITASGITGALGARTGSGSIRLERIQGSVSASTGSGSINVVGATGSEIGANTGSGNIRMREVTAQSLVAGTGSGGIAIETLSADDVRATTGSGTIRLELTKVPRSTLLRTGSGGAQLTLPRNPNVEVDISTGSGGISSDFPVTMRSIRRQELQGTIGDGTAGRIRISTGSGSVRLLQP